MANPVQRDAVIEVAFGADLTADPTGWSWTDVSADLLAQAISVNRGRADESGETQPMATSLRLDNISGDYTPDNPAGDHYPNVRRGTPLRITVPGGESYFLSGYPQTSTVSTPDTAALDITGDIDIRFDFAAPVVDDDDVSTFTDLGGKFAITGNQRSWRVILDNNRMFLQWSADGTSTVQNAQPTLNAPRERVAWRITLDVNNGAGGWTVTFYTARTIDGPWEQFGDPVVGVGTTSIFSSTAPLTIGALPPSSFHTMRGKVWAFQVYNGIGGTLVADADFRDLDPGTTVFTDSAGRTWTVAGGGEITDYYTRFVGQVDEWAPTWPAGDVTGDEPPHAVVDITASSVRRRLAQGEAPLAGPIQRAILGNAVAPKAYWPMEDGPNSTSIASALSDGTPMTLFGTPNFAASAVFEASAALPEMALASAYGRTLSPAATGLAQARFLMQIPAGGATNNAIILRMFTSGTAPVWDLRYTTGGNLALEAYDADGVQLFSSGAAFAVDGKPLLVLVEAKQNGANIDWRILTIGIVSGVGLNWLGTLNNRTVGAATAVQISLNRLLDATVIGHLMVYSVEPGTTFEDALRGWAGESAVERFLRLSSEESIGASTYGGDDVPSEAMGVQLPAALTELLAQCAESDDGILLDRRDVPGLLFRPRATLYRQDPDLVLDAAVNEIANPFAPVLDDQRIRNDITVARAGGSSARAVDQVSVDEEGRYDDAVELSLFTDDQTIGQAWWRLHLGTVPGMRYGTITVDFDTAPDSLLRQWLSDLVDVGDLIRVRNLPRQHAPDDLDLIVQGYTESISQSRWQVTFSCSSASPYRVGIYDGDGETESRYSSGGTTLAEDLDTTETSIDISTPTGPVWTTDAGQYPLDINIGGERITAGGCTGTGASQTFTGCTRSVNGVVKTHTTGAVVDLFTPTYYAL